MKKIILLAMLPCVAVILAGCTGEKPSEPATSGGGSTHTHEDGSTHDDHAEEGSDEEGDGVPFVSLFRVEIYGER